MENSKKFLVARQKRRALTVDEVAGALNLSPGLVRKLIAAEQLRAFRAGRLWRIPASALDDYLNGNR